MKALIKDGPRVGVGDAPEPALATDDDVILRVAVAGICRTDVYVAEGRIAVAGPRILGHEASGTVAAVGARVARVKPGDRVTVMPAVPCGACRACGSGAACGRPRMLGVDRHGAFAERVMVPASCVHALPDGVSFRAAAYVEPLAAALAVRKAGLRRGGTGVIFGRNRIAELVLRVLRSDGFANVAIHDPEVGAPLELDAFDFAIETVATAASLRALIGAVRPGGTIVLKSRPYEPIAVDLAAAVTRDLTLRGVGYAPFDEAIALVASPSFPLEDLLGVSYALDDFARAFDDSQRPGSPKLFFAIGGTVAVDR